MKKIFFIVTCCFLLIILCEVQLGTYLGFTADNFFNFFKTFEGVNFCYVLDCDIGLEFVESEAFNVGLPIREVKNGAKSMVYFTSRGYHGRDIEEARYKQVYLKNEGTVLSQIINKFNVKVLFSERFEEKILNYGFSGCFDDFVYLNGFRINIQIVTSGSEVVVGTPMVYSSY